MKCTKKLLAVIVCVSIIMLGTQSAFSLDSEIDIMNSLNHYGVLNETVELDNNEMFVCSYGLNENSPCNISLHHKSKNSNYVFLGQYYIDAPMKVTVKESGEYELFVCNAFSGKGSQDKSFIFDNTKGVYQKVRFRLSADPHFNYDGSHILDGKEYNFAKDFTIDDKVYSSALVFVSGGCINMVAPDRDGYVELYVSTELGVDTEFFTVYSERTYVDDYHTTEVYVGEFGKAVHGFSKGMVDLNTDVSIMDVTVIQQYIAQLVSFYRPQKYRADVDNDGQVSIIDATMVQQYLAKV